jgi:hypothetical protein
MRQVIVFTAFNRPLYLSETLESWSHVRGIRDAILDFHIEPGSTDVDEVCASVNFVAGRALHVNPTRLGIQRNPFNAINCGFTYGDSGTLPQPDDFVILAEDDFVVSTDVLEWFAWARKEFYSDERVLLVSANQYEQQSGGLAQSLFIPWFPGWVWGTWRDRWQSIADDWTFEYEHNGWDWRLTDHFCGELHKVCVVPAISRSQHIGEFNGVHTIAGTWFREQQSKCFQPEVPPQVYRRPTGVSMIRNPRG